MFRNEARLHYVVDFGSMSSILRSEIRQVRVLISLFWLVVG